MTKSKSGKRAQFGSRLGVIAATVGSAVGLGNIWRFPYEAGTGGGGAFLVCYIISVFLMGIPAICAEFCMGRSSRKGLPGAYRWPDGKRKWDLLGYAGVFTAFMILSFYAVVSGWTLEYIVDSVSGLFQESEVDSMHSRFTTFVSGWRAVAWGAVFLLINAMVMLGGVQKGIERVSRILMPILFLILIAFCINSLTMPGASKGLSFLFHPDFSKLTPPVILSAIGQAFFSLSLGMGCLVTYSSYFSDSTPLLRTSIEIAVLDTLVAVLAGVVIFPAVFSFGMSPAEGPTLVFEVLPSIFHSMAGGRLWSTLFFILLALASLTSVISISEILVAFFTDEFRMTRRKATAIVTGTTVVTSALCSLSFGPLKELNLFNIFDYLSSNVFMTLGGMGACIFAGWKMGKEQLRAQLLTHGVSPWLYRVIVFCMRWVAPACILAVFIAGVLH